MILNINGCQTGGKLTLCPPNILLDQRFTYKIGVHRLYFELNETSQPEMKPDNTMLLLCTNLVDRSSMNPEQSIVYFNYKAKQNNAQSYNANHVIYYNLRLLELANATFDLRTLSGADVNLSISKIFIQLEILRADSYGRVQ